MMNKSINQTTAKSFDAFIFPFAIYIMVGINNYPINNYQTNESSDLFIITSSNTHWALARNVLHSTRRECHSPPERCRVMGWSRSLGAHLSSTRDPPGHWHAKVWRASHRNLPDMDQRPKLIISKVFRYGQKWSKLGTFWLKRFWHFYRLRSKEATGINLDAP